MQTRVEHMKALKAAWERAPMGPQKEAALTNYEAAQNSNIARMEKAAMDYLRKAEAALR